MTYRRHNSHTVRSQATQMARDRVHPPQLENSDEQRFRHCAATTATHGLDKEGLPSYLASFTKGLPHHPDTGLIDNPDHYQLFVRAIDSGDFRDFRDTPLGHDGNCNGSTTTPPAWLSAKAQGIPDLNVRAWESQSAGLAFDLQGPDAQALTMPPAPSVGSDELTAEMAEIYAQALLRDVPFRHFSAGVMGLGVTKDKDDISATNFLDIVEGKKPKVEEIKTLTDEMADLPWFAGTGAVTDPQVAARRRTAPTPATAFRGITRGDDVGPYLSQFLLAGDAGFDGERTPADGRISYGAIDIDQRIRVAEPGKDYMTSWEEYLDVQNAADLRGQEAYQAAPARRFIYTPRDLATYVHYDALYEAYLNACLLLLGNGTPFDPGIPFQTADNIDHQQGFAHFGGPHILSLVTEVATRALKAVRFQKYNVHRRCRPEVMAARIHKVDVLRDQAPELMKMAADLSNILDEVKTHNAVQNGSKPPVEQADSHLLPMAFCEGSPMHPAYGAGHATVAGACVTILKAFFDHCAPLSLIDPSDPAASEAQQITGLVEVLPFPGYQLKSANLAFVPTNNGQKLDVIPVLNKDCKLAQLTVEGELNKLASNIAIGRNWAGVHYFTDYYESLLMGEAIAIAILEEQKLTFGENFSMTLPKFDGSTIRI
ncbi:vanadium-dependent haloperoxidase [Neolewinella agarilytica]|uniref:vanadium-dependent haloperoxidase n=1 Tax=Neolewinella agarilytica TaxID=478744 RepID=UPI002354578A|nr:vanadium-dependent haloperoxidase [Neolewinella agarilytica]